MADVVVTVEAQFDGSTWVNITDRCTKVQISTGRQGGHLEYPTGTCRVVLSQDDNFLTPNSEDATYDAVDVQNKKIRVRASVDGETGTTQLFGGTIDRIRWLVDSTNNTVAIEAVDDLAALAEAEVRLANAPTESTGSRFRRILTAAGVTLRDANAQVDSGVVRCLSGENLTGNALTMLREVASTDGGNVFVRHGNGLNSDLWFLQRENSFNSSSAPTLSFAPAGANDAHFVQPPQLEIDPQLLVTKCEFTSGEGNRISYEDTAQVAKYGERVLSRATLSSDADTTALAIWWAEVYGKPAVRSHKVSIDTHLETATAAQACIGATIGLEIALSLLAPGSTTGYTTLHIIEGVTWEVRPLDMAGGFCYLRATYDLGPIVAVSVWEAGVSALGTDTRLAVGGVFAGPGGRVRWATGDKVTAADFAAGATSQAIPRYPDRAARDQSETRPQQGMTCMIGPEAGQWYLEVYQSGVGWQILGVSS